MKKLSDEEKAELQTKMERAQRERIRRIAEQSEGDTSLTSLDLFSALAALLRAVFRRRDSDIADGTRKRAPRGISIWPVLLSIWIFSLLLIISGSGIVIAGLIRGGPIFGSAINGIVPALAGIMLILMFWIAHVPMPTSKTAREYKVIKHVDLGNTYRERGDLDEATAQYELAIGVDTEPEGAWMWAHYSLGTIYQERGDKQQAIAHFKEFVSVADSDPILRNRIPKVQEWIEQLENNQ